MKKYIVLLISFLCMVGICGYAQAQELSKAKKIAVYSGGLSAPVTNGTQKTLQKKIAKRPYITVLRFEHGQDQLSNIQKELLYQLTERMQRRKTNLEISIFTENSEDAKRWDAQIRSFINTYISGTIYTVRIVTQALVDSNRNSVKIREKY